MTLTDIANRAEEIEALKARVDELEICLKERKAVCHQAFDANEALKAERDALAAQVEALRSAIEPFATGGVCSAIDREDYSIMRERIKDWHGVIEFKKAQDAYNSTPRQCLRDVQAEAGWAGYYEGFKAGLLVERPALPQQNAKSAVDYFKLMIDRIAKVNADEYAATVRQGGAE